MRRFNAIALLVLLLATFAHGQAFEVACPAGSSSLLSPTYNPTTQRYRAWACVNATGNVTLLSALGFPLLAPDGTIAAPSYSFSSQSGTGFSYLNTQPLALDRGVPIFSWGKLGDPTAAGLNIDRNQGGLCFANGDPTAVAGTACLSSGQTGVVVVGNVTGGAGGIIQTAVNLLALSVASINANTCSDQSVVVTPSGTTGGVVKWSFAGSPIGVTGYGTGALQISTYLTAVSGGTAHIVVCNITGASVTPGAISVNIRIEL